MAESRDLGKADSGSRKQGRGGSAFPGVISVLELYTVEEAKARLRWSDSALRAAKRRGLRLLICGKRRYITGREIVRFLQTNNQH